MEEDAADEAGLQVEKVPRGFPYRFIIGVLHVLWWQVELMESITALK